MRPKHSNNQIWCSLRQLCVLSWPLLTILYTLCPHILLKGSASEWNRFCGRKGQTQVQVYFIASSKPTKSQHVATSKQPHKSFQLCNCVTQSAKLMWTKISKWESLHTSRAGLWTRRKKKAHPLCPYLVWLTLPILPLEHISPNIHWPLWLNCEG